MENRHKHSNDPNISAASIVAEATGQSENIEIPQTKNPYAVALGRLGGQKGGKARAEKLSAQERKEIAQKAARARWNPITKKG